MKNRKSPRLKGYDYGKNGAYFVTICTKDREPFFGEIIDGKIKLSEIGDVCEECRNKIPNHFDNVKIDTFVVMPDHIHGIIIIDDQTTNGNVGTQYFASKGNEKGNVGTSFMMSNKNNNNSKKDTINRVPTTQSMNNNLLVKNSLGYIVRHFKGKCTYKINKTCVSSGFQRQGRYRDRIIRNEDEYTRISQYIIDNPLKWELDKNENGIFM